MESLEESTIEFRAPGLANSVPDENFSRKHKRETGVEPVSRLASSGCQVETVKLVDEALRGLALARPEVKELFPGLWARRALMRVVVYLALAEARLALDEVSAGESAPRQALRYVHERASDIPDATARERFLRQVPQNARTLELARQRWGDSEPGGAPRPGLTRPRRSEGARSGGRAAR
jgi:hypothetical protein